MDNPASPHRENPEPIVAAENGETYVDPPLPPEQLPAVRALGRLLDGRPLGAAELPTLPGYEILGELGRGGMGVVYQARQVGLNRIVALKMVLAGPFGSSDSVARLRAEAEAAARLRHPHIVQVYEIGEWKGLPFFSLEYMDGGTVAERLQRSPLSPGDAAELPETLARAVDAAHAQGIIHRDLKPGNILLQNILTTEDTEEPRGKATDFLPLRSSVSSDPGNAKLHGARAGRRSHPSRRSCRGCLCAGSYPV
jgi:serine/threonine protein kinase